MILPADYSRVGEEIFVNRVTFGQTVGKFSENLSLFEKVAHQKKNEVGVFYRRVRYKCRV